LSTVFFIHLQKTAGTSINQAAVEEFSRERVLMLYGRDSQWTSPAALQIVSRAKANRSDRLAALSSYIEENDVAFFSSHVSAALLRCFDPSRAFTILRNPVERVISQYFFFRQKDRTKESLGEFVERPENRNLQSRTLQGLELESLAAVGVVERYGLFLSCLNRRLGLHFRQSHQKRGGFLKNVRSKMISPLLRRRIAALNENDAALYERALEIAQRRGA